MAVSGNIRIEINVDKPAPDLKELLFKETVCHREIAFRFINIYGRYDPRTIEAKAKFTVCFSLIIRANLEDEYYEWQKQRKEIPNEQK